MAEDTGTVFLRICQEGHANALALNKDFNQIAVAGRSLLKVYSIEPDGFMEVCNMRCGKNQNLSYSSNDVAWSTLDNNTLATAATNGVVSVWDLSKFGRQKQLWAYNEHERTAHTVTFHSTEAHLLVSGSQDGTIKCFDLRTEKSLYTYFSNSESVRDVKFSPHSTNTFSAVSENGTVQLWDLRKWDKCILQFTAHSGPIYTCDWHPTKNWLATGSRDKQIKVWNMDGKASLEHTIHTIAVVGRVKWRPDRTYHIASCALVVDYSIHVWDIRRPFIPFASFNEHSNITTGMAWKGNDPHSLISTSKDSTVYKHVFRDATRPALRANSQGASLGRRGEIYFANKKKILAPLTTAQVVKTNSFINRTKQAPGVEQFHLAQSSMHKFKLKVSHMDLIEPEDIAPRKEHECFIGCAKELMLAGKKLSDMCEHNINVCKKYGKYNAITLWNFIKTLYGSNDFNVHKYEHRNSMSNQKRTHAASRRPTQINNAHDVLKWENDKRELAGNNGVIDIDVHKVLEPLNGNNVHVAENCPPYGTVILSETQILSEINFDNFDLLCNGFIYVGPQDFSKALTFPETALHRDVQAPRSQKLDLTPDNREKSPHQQTNEPGLLKVSHIPPLQQWEPHQFIADALTLQSDMSDVQTSLSIVICLGEARKFLPLTEALIEHWFHTYIDQLHRFQLWNEACNIMNLSWVRSVRAMNQQSTSVHTNCGGCGRPLSGAVGWFCRKCKSLDASKCSICDLPVRGLYAWCQGCSHGGHIHHLMEYFSNRSKCPKCGHLCEYN